MLLTCWEAGVVGLQIFKDARAGIRSTDDICTQFTHSLAITPTGNTRRQ